MGKFIYGTAAASFEIDDRALAHLRIVIMNKLRRSESFMFDLTISDGSGHRSFWINPAVSDPAPVLWRPRSTHQPTVG